MTDFEQKLAQYHNLVGESLPDFLPPQAEVPRSVLDAMAYGLLGTGKRIRAIVLLAFYEYCGGPHTKEALPFAAAIEMIHAYSMIHDDLPCMDDDDMRRGKASCHVVYGEATALLAGDGLFTLAFETLTTPACVAAFGAQRVVQAVQALAHAAGPCGMVGGQVMDLENEGVSVSAEELMRTDEKKTGALLRVSAEIGCILAGADEGTTAAALQYAADLGLAFQVVDDILDATADEATLGKPVGSDEDNEKSTYVSVYGLDRAAEIAAELSASAAEALRKAGGDCEFLVQLVDFLCNRTY